VVPIYEGYPLAHAALRSAVSGRELTRYLGKLLAEEGHALTRSADREILRDIKEKLCYVAVDFDAEQKKAASGSALEKDYASPDGGVIPIGRARFMTAEVLFKPSLIGMEQQGLHELVCDAIMKCDPDIRRELYANIVLGGGTTMVPGIVERLQGELSRLAPPEIAIGVVASPQRKDASWLGGALLLASLSPSAQAERWISRAEYDDVGPSIVERKSL
jgi:actin-related protein